MREETKQDIMGAGEVGTQYDRAAKAVWRNREILAPLLKYAVTELADESVESIMKLIDADSISSEEIPVSDLPPTVTTLNAEDSSITEKLITYDLKFTVKNPRLSSDKLQNTATRYYLSREDFIGTAVEPEADYDLMEVIMIRRGDAKDITEPLFKYLESVYKADIKEIEAYTPVSGNPELKKEVESMPGMSPVIYNNGLAEGVLQGISQGISQGITQGIEQGQNLLVETVQRLRNGESREEIIASGVDEHTVDLAMTIR